MHSIVGSWDKYLIYRGTIGGAFKLSLIEYNKKTYCCYLYSTTFKSNRLF